MHKIIYQGKEYEIPGDVNELTPEQYRNLLAGLVFSQEYQREGMREKLILLQFINPALSPDLLTNEAMAELEGVIDGGVLDGFFAISAATGEKYLDLSTPLNKLPVAKCRGKEYRGPGDYLEGLSFGDFIECVTLADEYFAAEPSSEESGSAIENLCKILYRIPKEEEVPILLYYHAPSFFFTVWRMIQKEKIEIDGREIDFSIIFKSSGKRKPDDKTGWTGILFEVAAAGLFGDVEQVKKAPFWEVLLYLYKCKFEYIHQEKESR